jgi:hypothetical protein
MKIYIKYKHKVRFMNKKSASDSLSRKMDLINKKVREINERRRGVRLTRIEDELDRQELKSYARLMGVEHGNVSLESVVEETYAPRNGLFYATLALEALTEVLLLYMALSYLLAPSLTTVDYLISAALIGIFMYIGYTMYRSMRNK